MNALRGWLAALGSVLLASAAQLGMRWGMSRLPLPEAWAGQTPERAALLAVALLAASLPAFDETFSTSKTLGVGLVVLGVLTVNARRTAAAPAHHPSRKAP